MPLSMRLLTSRSVASRSVSSRLSRTKMGLLVDVVGQAAIAGAAALGVLTIAGCTSRNRAPASDAKMVDTPPPEVRSAGDSKNSSRGKTGGAMSNAMTTPPDSRLIETDTADIPAISDHGETIRIGKPLDPVANPKEKVRKEQAAQLLNEAMVAPPQPIVRAPAVLRTAERAVGPLADTLGAIESAEKVVIDNVRNAETVGFKSIRTAVNDGKDISKQLDLAQGPVDTTGRALDIAIEGDGFLPVQFFTREKAKGAVGYTRNGRLFVSKEGRLVVGEGDGYEFVPPIAVPVGTTELHVRQDGTITVVQGAAEKAEPQTIGRIPLARFTDPTALQPLGGGIYGETDASGPAVESTAGERGAGQILQGFLEGSNVDLVRERLRLRFLQGWRASILAALDGEPPEARK